MAQENKMASQVDTSTNDEKEHILKNYKKRVTPEIMKLKNYAFKKYKYESKMFEDNSITYQDRENAFKIKQKEMRQGDLAQICLGCFLGYIDLGNGHITGLDIMKKDNSEIGDIKLIIIQIITKFNTFICKIVTFISKYHFK